MTTTLLSKPTKNRSFIPNDFSLENWDVLKPYYEYLLTQEIHSPAMLERFLREASELEAVVEEDMAWRYIRMTCDTLNAKNGEDYQFFVQEILPHLSVYADKLNRKIAESPYWDGLDKVYYKTYFRSLKNEIALFREENIPLSSEEQSLTHEYSGIMGKMTIEHEGNTLTMQQAGKLLESQDRTLREEIWRKMANRRLENQQELDDLFDKLVKVRNSIAQNAGFSSYTDYKYAILGRFDYTRKDCETFRSSVEKVVTPFLNVFAIERKKRLGLADIRPWDTSVDIFSDKPLSPFENGKELIEKSVHVLRRLRPELGDMIALMEEINYLDVESRIGKAPGGYNYPLAESGVPFIFMNAAGSQGDVTTMLHEAGHAVHSFVSREIPINSLKRVPSEVAEVASMTMELFTLDFYEEFYPDAEERKRAQKEQIMRSLTVFPWIATVDAFQHWIYDNPNHTQNERKDNWVKLYQRFQGEETNWEGLERVRDYIWMRQLHIFEMPFYYIEYAFAQLGAIAIWRNYKQNPTQSLDNYLNMLALGYTRTLPELFEAAGISFNFSADYVQELVDFCWEEYQKLG